MKRYYDKDDDIQRYWELRYQEWLKSPDWGVYQSKWDWFNARFAHLLPIPREPVGLVLDYGCGNGLYSSPLLQRYSRYFGVDTSPTALDIARNKFGIDHQRSFWLIHENPLEGWRPLPQFNLVLSITVLQHQPIENRLRIIEWIKSVIRPGGLYVGLEMMGSPQAYDMPPMPESDWRKAWEPFTMTYDAPKEHPEWADDNIWVGRIE